jgi:hypothetical protein
MKTERDFGRENAEWMVDNGQVEAGELVNIDEMVGGTVDSPSGDYDAMKEEGIENPSARLYWKGYNEYMSEIGE